jgi:hypothetical protein
MAHHARLVQGRLSVENQDIPVLQMAIHLLVHGTLGEKRSGDTSTGTLRNREKCVGNRLSLIPAGFILQKIVGDFDRRNERAFSQVIEVDRLRTRSSSHQGSDPVH